jgi:hypothetical protein
MAENGHEMGLDVENEPRRVLEGGDDENGLKRRIFRHLGLRYIFFIYFSTFFIINNHSFTFFGFTYEIMAENGHEISLDDENEPRRV